MMPPHTKSWLIGKDWCWEGLGAGGEEDDRGWDGWIASQTRWTWVWVNSGRWWWTGRPDVLRFMGCNSCGRKDSDKNERLNWTEPYIWKFLVHILLNPSLKDFKHNLFSIWNQHSFTVVWILFCSVQEYNACILGVLEKIREQKRFVKKIIAQHGAIAGNSASPWAPKRLSLW